MTNAVLTKKINKTTNELYSLFADSKRKLLELEVMLSAVEIRKGKFSVFKSARALIKDVSK